MLATLRECQARYYKLTPPLTVENLQAGHGFHFILPGGPDGDVFLDVTGNPPRVGSFASALKTARRMETEWGALQTIGIKALVELKKTQRLEDYPIISRLSLAWFDQPECAGTSDDFLWALRNIFTIPELTIFFTEHPAAVDLANECRMHELGRFGRALSSAGEVPESTEQRTRELHQRRIARLQMADRRHWRVVIRALKELRAAGELMREGEAVYSDCQK